MKIDPGLQRTKTQDINKQLKAEEAKGKPGTAGKSGQSLKTDTVTISEKARILQRTESKLQSLKAQGDSSLPVRRDRVDLAKAKLEGGQFDLEKVVEGTAEAILRSGTLSDIVSSNQIDLRARLTEAGSLGAGAEKLAQVRDRIDSGYYDSPEVAREIADKMLEDLYP